MSNCGRVRLGGRTVLGFFVLVIFSLTGLGVISASLAGMAAMTKASQIAEVVIACVIIDMIHIQACSGTPLPQALHA